MVVFSFSRVKQPKKNCSLSFDYITVDDEGITILQTAKNHLSNTV